jgi:hypothetical protein
MGPLLNIFPLSMVALMYLVGLGCAWAKSVSKKPENQFVLQNGMKNVPETSQGFRPGPV